MTRQQVLKISVLVASSLAIVACSESASISKDSGRSPTSAGTAGSSGSSGAAGAGVPSLAMDPASSPPSPSATTTTEGKGQAGQLTAGTWDDNANFDFYTRYLSKVASDQVQGLPAIDRSARMVILVQTPAGEPAAGALVQVTDAAQHAFTSTTGGEGRVLFFPGWYGVAAGAALTITATLGSDSVRQTAVAASGTVIVTLEQTERPTVGALDLAFVIDTTGSMGDELLYVQNELGSIVNGISAQFPSLAQRFALIVYRDTGDAYVVRSFDFTADLATFRRNLNAQSADGGGDMPEAVDQALGAASTLTWNPGATARLAFWIADAPHHVGRESAVVSALRGAVSQGVHVYPIAASGINDLGEFTMRTAAEVTGGRYLFLTDDSGIGNTHAEPHIPCYYVTTLESAIRRMVLTEVSGYYAAPLASDILRSTGSPEGQQCSLSGTVFTVW